MSSVTRAAITGYPVNLVVHGRRCVGVGAGRIAARKIDGLLAAGARVHVIAPDVGEEVRGWAADGLLTLDRRAFASWDPTSHEWVVPAGTYGLWVGRSSRHLELAGEVSVEDADGR